MIELRYVEGEELAGYARARSLAFNNRVNEERLPRLMPVLTAHRCLAAFDGGQDAWAPASTCTTVSVCRRPDRKRGRHDVGGCRSDGAERRRGVLRAMVERQLSDAREQGVALAALFPARRRSTGGSGLGLPRRGQRGPRSRPITAPSIGRSTEQGTLEMIEQPEPLDLLREVHEQARVQRPATSAGTPPTRRAWSRRRIVLQGAAPERRRRARRVRGVQRRAPLGGRAAAPHRRRARINLGLGRGPPLTLALSARPRPGGRGAGHQPPAGRPDPLAAPRAPPFHRPARVKNGMWLRKQLDVAAALAEHGYLSDGAIRLEVAGVGRFELEAAEDSAAASRPRPLPNIRLPASSLGFLYLGGVSAETLLAAGRLRSWYPAPRRGPPSCSGLNAYPGARRSSSRPA